MILYCCPIMYIFLSPTIEQHRTTADQTADVFGSSQEAILAIFKKDSIRRLAYYTMQFCIGHRRDFTCINAVDLQGFENILLGRSDH